MSTNEHNRDASSKRVTNSTLVVMGGFALSIVAGIFRQRVVANTFGTGIELDAFSAANGIPELLVIMLSSGALGFAFIPIYTQLLNNGEKDTAAQLWSQVINNVLLLTAIASVGVVVFSPSLVSAPWGIVPSFNVAAQKLTVDLMRILLLSTILFSASSILTGILHAHQHFLLPALAPTAYTGGILFGALALAPKIGIYGLAWGAVLGALAHISVQLPGLLKIGVRWKLTLGWRNKQLHRVGILMAPRVLDLLMARISIDWLSSNIGSGLGEGRISALRYGFTLMNLPWTMIGTAIGIAVFPTMAELAAKKELRAQKQALSGALRAILTLTLPAAAGLIVLGKPVIQVLYEGGEFTPHSTELVYYALQFFALTLISQSVLEVVVRAFASQQDTYTPLFISIFTTALNFGLAFWLAAPDRLSHGGLALANGIAVGIEALIGLTILHIRWKGIDAKRIIIDTIKAGVAAGIMAGIVVLFKTVVTLTPLMTFLIGGVIGISIYFIVALLLGLEEIWDIPKAFLKKFF